MNAPDPFDSLIEVLAQEPRSLEEQAEAYWLEQAATAASEAAEAAQFRSYSK